MAPLIRAAAALLSVLALSGPAGAQTSAPLASVPGIASFTCRDMLQDQWPTGIAGQQLGYVTGYITGVLDHGGAGDSEAAFDAVQSYCMSRPAARLLEVLEALRSARSESAPHFTVRRR
jgi:hypothetical protein